VPRARTAARWERIAILIIILAMAAALGGVTLV
jgi:hypothetical protein